MSALALGAIRLYRTHLSPRKGFRCAHHALHQTGSCSDFGLRVFADHGLIAGTALMRRRFAACAAAARALRLAMAAASGGEQAQSGEEGERKRKGDAWCAGCDVPMPGLWVPRCSGPTTEGAGCADVGVCDFGGCFSW
jgi:putative component of membrane protein insertase Oxa1/YidC/SpoIIIJ protein YidD